MVPHPIRLTDAQVAKVANLLGPTQAASNDGSQSSAPELPDDLPIVTFAQPEAERMSTVIAIDSEVRIEVVS